MPTYQYRCTHCGHDLEAVQKFTDAALTECPNCGGPLRKIYNAVGVVFKGSGFYRNDSRTTPSEGGSTSTSGSSGDSTSAPATESGGSSTPKKEKKETAPAASTSGGGSSTGTTTKGS